MFIGLIGIIILVIAVSGCTDVNEEDIEGALYAHPITDKNQQESFKAEVQVIPVPNLLKDSYAYLDEKVKYAGKIVTIGEEASTSRTIDKNTRMVLQEQSTGEYLYVTIRGTIPHVKGDYITVYGVIGGDWSYESQSGNSVSVPLIKAVFIE